MKAYVRCGEVEHALVAPVSTVFGPICDHLGGRSRSTFERIAKLDRERTPGEHAFDRLELLELVLAAHSLLCDPPMPVRKLRRVAEGPLPSADRIGELCEWLRAQREAQVIYDLWRSVLVTS